MKRASALLPLALGIAIPLVGAALALPAFAALSIPPIVPDCARNATTAIPGIDCVLQAFSNVAKLILGITGSVALLMFVWGGFFILTAAGNESQVTKGKTYIKNAVIGIIIIVSAGYLIDYGVRALTSGSQVQVIGQSCECTSAGCGTYYQIPGKTDLKCVHTCSDLGGGSSHYACIDSSAGAVSGDCIAGLCKQGQACCPSE